MNKHNINKKYPWKIHPGNINLWNCKIFFCLFCRNTRFYRNICFDWYTAACLCVFCWYSGIGICFSGCMVWDLLTRSIFPFFLSCLLLYVPVFTDTSRFHFSCYEFTVCAEVAAWKPTKAIFNKWVKKCTKILCHIKVIILMFFCWYVHFFSPKYSMPKSGCIQ